MLVLMNAILFLAIEPTLITIILFAKLASVRFCYNPMLFALHLAIFPLALGYQGVVLFCQHLCFSLDLQITK